MTTENVFSAALTIALLAGGAAAFGSDVLAERHAPDRVASATLPTVTVTGHRVATATVTLPTVTVVGRRVTPTTLAAASRTVEQRVE